MHSTIQKKKILHDPNNAKPHYFILEIKDKQNPTGPTIHWVIVERKENYNTHEGTVQDARLTLKYKILGERGIHERGSFFSGYRRNYDGTEIVSLSSTSINDGGIFLDPASLRSQRLGTYLMNEVVGWVKQWPEASVNPIKLLDSNTEKIRRNRFYERFGLVFYYHADKSMSTQSEPMLTSDLQQVDSWEKNIREHDWLEAIDNLIVTHNSLSLELNLAQKTIKELVQINQKFTDKPIRWALRYSLSLPKLLIALCCLLIGIGIYLR